jgi:hypothetical protein
MSTNCLRLPMGDAVCHITDRARYFVILSVQLRWRVDSHKKSTPMRLKLDPSQLPLWCQKCIQSIFNNSITTTFVFMTITNQLKLFREILNVHSYKQVKTRTYWHSRNVVDLNSRGDWYNLAQDIDYPNRIFVVFLHSPSVYSRMVARLDQFFLKNRYQFVIHQPS